MLDLGSIANVRQALRMYERCIELSPTSKNPSQNRLLALNYLSGHSVMNGPRSVLKAVTNKIWKHYIIYLIWND